MRYSNTDRLGVIETDRIVTKELGWIFREQPIVDVGIDAIIEKADYGEPKGEFIAVQIKSGLGNFLNSETKLTLYVSKIHHNYWLNLNIPIILVAHLPESNVTFWEIISEETFKKTNKKWKLEISKKQLFNSGSKNRIEDYLKKNAKKNTFSFDFYSGKFEESTLYDYVENVNCISEAALSLNSISRHIQELGNSVENNNIKLRNLINQNLTINDLQVRAVISNFGRIFNLCSIRLESEIDVFSNLFSMGFSAFEVILNLHFKMTGDLLALDKNVQLLFGIPQIVNNTIKEVEEMREKINILPNKLDALKEPKKMLLLTVDMLLFEFITAKNFTEFLLERIDKLKN